MKKEALQEFRGILGERETQVLHTIILQYINTGEPVGSRTVAKSSGLSLSPATIRNIMFDLEEQGLLRQPHQSAGRVPTSQGFRYYVDHMLASRDLQASTRRRIEGGFKPPAGELNDLIRQASRVLSKVSGHPAIVRAPKPAISRIRHIQFINAGAGSILTVLVSVDGLVQNRFIDNLEQFSQEQLDRFSRYLNGLLQNLSLVEARQTVLMQMEQEKVLFDRMLLQALMLSQKALQAEEDRELYVEGASQILDYPEFADIEKIRALFRAFEEKHQLIRLLDESLGSEGVKIFLSPEITIPTVEWSLVSTNFQRDLEPIGTLGIIGPLRMNYDRIIPLVQFTAEVMSGILNNWPPPLK
ncbi:heat-inducible transcriptional repressor HrcA [Desulfobacca acetoxidans]|uniref:Heat-inducible transcription repressor HrcA n=1 Tax=Desulfobacca acetoxidans (strain ATCC 700848 / DSM 11109 / ASRB2) TaxID=880072 RepID=F2NCA9_DESAR|nr:heat-inducible transcriptional repressor HrcA [Desulfobacca acetoxidans]AEB08973.1 heat-inducible transcription repressor HrcA [Desulfobacca acetoxidans DSM 11109]HAY22720.1 heat-inducible transcription repressor HrcA [Desulfobacterales bacterium]